MGLRDSRISGRPFRAAGVGEEVRIAATGTGLDSRVRSGPSRSIVREARKSAQGGDKGNQTAHHGWKRPGGTKRTTQAAIETQRSA